MMIAQCIHSDGSMQWECLPVVRDKQMMSDGMNYWVV